MKIDFFAIYRIIVVVTVICFIAFVIFIISFAGKKADPEKTILPYETEYKLESGTVVRTICVDGYKFLVTRTPGGFDKDEITQIFTKKDGISVPELCTKRVQQ